VKILELFRKSPEEQAARQPAHRALVSVGCVVVTGIWLLGLGQVGCADGSPHRRPKAAVPQPAATVALSFARDSDVETLCARVEAALAAHQYHVLDATEAAMRDPDVRLVGGNSQIYHFYAALAVTSDRELFSCSSPYGHDQKRQWLADWVAAEPASLAAHIAMAQFWANAGWVARGNDYSDKVTELARHELGDDLKKASTALMGIDEGSDPHGYFVRLTILRGEPNPREELDRVYALAVKKYPGYFHYYSQRSTVLQLRWYGQQGELQAYNASLLRSPGGDAGLVAFSYVAFNLMGLYARPTFQQTTGLSWPVVKLAYATRERLYGLRNRDWNALLNLSLAGIDRESAKAALEKIDGHWDPTVWKERRYFDEAVAWTTQTRK
jgi:hypothetical protein